MRPAWPLLLFLITHCNSVEPQLQATVKSQNILKLPEHAIAKLGRGSLRHRKPIRAISLSSDGELVASGGDDNVIRIWTTRTQQALRTLGGHEGGVTALAFQSNRPLLASGGRDGLVRIWKADTGSELMVLDGHTDAITSVSFSPDGKLIASASKDSSVRIWDIITRKQVTPLRVAAHPTSVAFATSGSELAVGTDDGTAVLWRFQTPVELKRFAKHQTGISSIAISAEGVIATGLEDGTIIYWHRSTDNERMVLRAHKGAVRAVSFLGSQRLISGGDDGALVFWNTTDAREVYTVKAHNEPVSSVSVAASPGIVATGSEDKLVRLWNSMGVAYSAIRTPVPGHSAEIRGLAYSPDGAQLVSCGNDSTIMLWNAHTYDLKNRRSVPERNLIAMAFSASGDALFSMSGTVDIRSWRVPLDTGSLLNRPRTGAASSAAFAVNGDKYAWAEYDKRVRVWNRVSDRLESVLELDTVTKVVSGIAFDSTSEYLAAGTSGNEIIVWNLSTGMKVQTLTAHADSVTALSFSPLGLFLASGDLSGCVLLWDVTTGKLVRQLDGMRDSALAISYSHDGQLVAAAGDDMLIHVWDVTTGQTLRTFAGHEDSVGVLAFSPSGRELASGSKDTTVLIWNLAPLNANDSFSLSQLWDDIGSSDAQLSYDATWKMAAQPEAIKYIIDKLFPTVDETRLQSLLNQLDSDLIEVRDSATNQLTDPQYIRRLRDYEGKAQTPEGNAQLARILQLWELGQPVEARRRAWAIEILNRVKGSIATTALKTIQHQSPIYRERLQAKRILSRRAD